MIISSNTNLIYINKLDFDPLQNIIKKKEKLLFIFDKKLEKNKAFLKLKKFFAKNNKIYELNQLHPEPTSDLIDELTKKFRKKKINKIVAVGGGSVIDGSKALSISLTNPNKIWDYVDLRYRPAKKLKNKPLDIIAIPSTAGTGAEISKNSVLINTKTIEKATIKFDECYPMYAILIPELTFSLNKFITSFTAFDAFAHCLESYLNINSNYFSNIYSLEGMKIIYNNLLKCIKKPNSFDLRKKLMTGSVFGGYSLKYAGTTTCHAIAQPLTARTGIPHGLAVSILTLPVLKYSIKKNRNLLNDIFDHIFLKYNKNVKDKTKFVYFKLEELLKKSLVNYKISDYYKEDTNLVEKLTNDTVGYMGRGLKFHPVKLSKNEIRNAIKEAI